MLAEYLDLSPATVSIVLNNSHVATSIPAATKQRVHAAAKKFNHPNLHARMLRSRLTHTIGIIAPELSEGYFTGSTTWVQPPQSSSSNVSTPPANPVPTTSASSPNSS
jgi:DNA-binding LacI/PurR family transcriptional regulator